MSSASSEPSPGPSTSGSLDVKSRMAERMAKLRSLHMKRTESRTLNHREVVEEDRRNKEPKNMEARKKRAEYELKEVSKKCMNIPWLGLVVGVNFFPL